MRVLPKNEQAQMRVLPLNKQGCVFYRRMNKQGCVFYLTNEQATMRVLPKNEQAGGEGELWVKVSLLDPDGAPRKRGDAQLSTLEFS
ncbi:MAG: hypothetical protein ACPGWR_09065 [Ardenticatenaceae bacterium]